MIALVRFLILVGMFVVAVMLLYTVGEWFLTYTAEINDAFPAR